MNWKFWKKAEPTIDWQHAYNAVHWDYQRAMSQLRAIRQTPGIVSGQRAKHPLMKNLTERFTQLEKDYDFLWRKHMDRLVEISELKTALYTERMKSAQQELALRNAAIQ